MTEPRSIDLSLEVPGTVEEVWAAIASGPGISSWFVPHQVDGAVGGKIRIDFGELGSADATVTGWEPPHRFAYESGGERPLAYEWLVESRTGDTCVVRIVTAGFGEGEGWDFDYDGMSGGWPILLESLRLQLTHFRGRAASATAVPVAMLPGPHGSAWRAFCAGLGVDPDLGPGARVTVGGLDATIAGVRRLSGATVYHLLVDGPVEGTGFLSAESHGETIGCSGYLYLYGDDAAATAAADAWSAAFASF